MGLMDMCEDDDTAQALMAAAEVGGAIVLAAFEAGLHTGAVTLKNVGTLEAEVTCDEDPGIWRFLSMNASTLRQYAFVMAAGDWHGDAYADELKKVKSCYTAYLRGEEKCNKQVAKVLATQWMDGIRKDANAYCASQAERISVVAHALLETGTLEAADSAQLVQRLRWYCRPGGYGATQREIEEDL